MRRFAACILLAAACALPQGALAVDIFGKFTGVLGESTDADHRDWIDVLAYSWGVSNAGSFGGGAGGGSGKVNFQDFSFTKLIDRSSPVLLLDLAKGTHIQEALFDLVEDGAKGQRSFLQYKFSDVLISSYSVGAGGGDVPFESWSFSFGKVEMKYVPQDAKGGPGSPVTFTWDLKKVEGDVMTTPIPEPSTWAMFVAGLLVVVYFGRNRVRERPLAT